MPKRKRKKDGGSKKEVKYQGITKSGKRFRAQIRIDGKKHYPGTFDTPKEAAQAYDRAAIEAGRPTSKLNFLDQVPKNYKPKKKKLSSTGNKTEDTEVWSRKGTGSKHRSTLVAKHNTLVCLAQQRRLLKRTIKLPSKQNFQDPS